MNASVLKRGLPLAVATVALLGTIGSAPASAAKPWWHLDTVSAPANPPGGESQIVVELANLGDAMINAEVSPVTIVDELPAGITATSAGAAGQGGNGVGLAAEGHLKCSLSGAGQTVTCQYEKAPLLSYERIMIVIAAKVASGHGTGVNEVSVSGGGAAPVVSRRPLALNGSPHRYGVENYELTPEEEGGAPDTQAGSHPFQLTATLTFEANAVPVFNTFTNALWPEVQPSAYTKDLHFNLPPGLLGNPTPLPQCKTQTFLEGLCPDNTAEGAAVYMVSNANHLEPVPYSATSGLYTLEPAVGEPARFGFLTIAGPVYLDTSVRTGGDYAAVVTVANIPENLSFIGTQVTFWGVPADPRHNAARGGKCLAQYLSSFSFPIYVFAERNCPVSEKEAPFLIMPTSCTGPLRTTVEGDSWQQPGQFSDKEYTFANQEGEPFGEDGCNRLNFEPSIKVAPDGTEGSSPTGLTIDVHVPQSAGLAPTGLAESQVKRTTVTLPVGVAINAAGGDGLLACGLGEIGLESPAEQSCPEAAKVATVEIRTPLLPNPLTGALYLAQQSANPFGSLVALYIVAHDPVSGVLIKLAGETKLDPVTGQLVSTFDTPQLPFEDATFHFFGGSRAPLGTPALCGSYASTGSFAPWSGSSPADSRSEFEITSGPNHSPCPNPPGDMSPSALPFHPSLTTGSLNLQAGAFTPFTLTMSRADGNQNLDAIQLKMPPGLLGTLAGVKLCGEAEGNAGTCGPESLIGETTVSVGLGGNPFSVKGGRVYITGPYKGAPYGLSIVNPAKAGPFDLENTPAQHPACDCVVVRAKIEVDPIDAALTITSDTTGPYAIPQIIEGIPLEIQHVNVTVNRPNFTFNPTNCSKMEIGGGLTSSQGATSALAVPFQVTNCATLAFKPQFKVSTAGKTSRKNGASLDVKLAYPKLPFGLQPNIAKVKVDLPKQLPSRLTTLQKACTDATFNANPAACPPGSRVGTATATTPIIPVALSGPAYFVSHGGAKFPELVIVLSGYGTTVQLHGETFISKAGITSSTFRTIPDVPIGAFELKLPQGTGSALAANGNLCKSTLKMPTTFVAQNGAMIHQSTPIIATGCAKHKAKKVNRHKKKK